MPIKVPDKKPYVGQMEDLYNLNSDYLYNKLSPYDGQSDNSLISFGPQQPYVYKKLTSTKKHDILSDLLSGSEVDDVVRMTKFTISSHGVFFLGKQLLLQRLQPFNETRIYNPASPIMGAVRGLGLTDYPMRHIDTSSPLTALGSIVGLGLSNKKTLAPGSVGGDKPNLLDEPKGVLRAGTANLAYKNLAKNASSGFSFGGIIGTALQIFNSFAVQRQTGNPTYRADENAYSIMSGSYFGLHPGQQKWTAPVTTDRGPLPWKSYEGFYPLPRRGQYDLSSSIIDNSYTPKVDDESEIDSPSLFGYKDKTQLSGDKESQTTKEILNSLYKILDEPSTSSVDISYISSKKDKRYYKEVGQNQSYESDSLMKEYNSINRLTILSGTNGVPDYRDSSGTDVSPTLSVPFYFYDLVNDKYIPFNATVKGINDTFTSEWSDVKYIGRADKLYNYIGYSRAVNFGFMVYANSMNELLPMWTRINYLCGLTKPSNYTTWNSSNKSGGISYDSNFIIPPMTKLTIGDFYKNQPIVLDVIGVTIPDDAQWETMKETDNGNDSIWKMGQVNIKLNSVKSDGIRVAQFPRICEIQIQGRLLEKERPQTGHNNWGDYYLAGGNRDNLFSQAIIGVPSETNQTGVDFWNRS